MTTATPSPLQTVREAAARVAEQASFVRVAGDPEEYLHSLLGSDGVGSVEAFWDVETHFAGGLDETVWYVLTLDAINFGSGYFPYLAKRPGRSGYFTVSLALKERFEHNGPITAGELRGASPGEVAALLGQPPGEEPLRDELMALYARAWRELGEFLEGRFGGSPLRLVEAARGSAEVLVNVLLEMPLFRDISNYRGFEVPLLKRAQITASDLALAIPDDERTRFVDLDELTIFADNLVPHVLRSDGLLEYAPELASRLERKDPVPAGSPEEVEIRAVALHAVEQMSRAAASGGVRASPRQLDLILWNRGQAERYRGGSKHRTLTTNY